MDIAVEARGERRTTPAPAKRPPLTPITRLAAQPTYIAPRRADGLTRGETWSALSRDGLWRYDRLDDTTSPWRITYLPTGQHVDDAFGTLNRARAATAEPRTLLELRRAAFTAALGPTSTVDGHRWLARHLRAAGADQADHRCQCGGMLAVVTANGRLGHVDACDRCTTIGEPGIAAQCSSEHRFCADPRVTR